MSLPTWTRDAGTMKRDIDEHGYCLVKEALTPAQLAEARKRLSEQAEAELKSGVAFLSDGRIPDDLGEFPERQYGNNQSVSFLANKGRIFREMAMLPDILDIVHHVLGEEIRIQNLVGLIIRSGGEEQTLHQDQWFVPSSGRYDEPMRAGSITRANPGQPETPGATLMPCIVCNVMWMLDDFTSENGATWIVPGSHKLGRRPNKDDLKNQMQVIGPAGNCFIFDGRLIHGSGAYLSQDPTGERKALTYAYQPPMFRPFENYPMALLPEVYEEASQELLDLLGFKVWFGIGHRGDFDAERISRDTPIIGELKP